LVIVDNIIGGLSLTQKFIKSPSESKRFWEPAGAHNEKFPHIKWFEKIPIIHNPEHMVRIVKIQAGKAVEFYTCGELGVWRS